MSKLKTLTDDTERLRTSPPAPVTLTSIENGDVRACLLLDGPLGPGGTPVRLVQKPGSYGLSMDEITRGGKRGEREISASGPGDVLVFENGYMEGDVLTVGKLGTRIHEGMTGPVQVARLLARPSKSSVSKRGVTQFATLVDPSVATVVRTREEFAAFARQHLVNEWPGGSFGLLLRTRDECADVMRDDDGKRPETLDAFVARMLDVNKIMDDGKPVELIPIWSLPMGQEQVVREGDVKAERASSIGRFSSLYGSHRTAFQPSLVLIGDEEEWAFGERTGNFRRAVLGMHPLRTDFDLQYRTLPSKAINNTTINPIKWLYKDAADLDRSVVARNERAERHAGAKAQAVAQMKATASAGFGSLRRFGGR